MKMRGIYLAMLLLCPTLRADTITFNGAVTNQVIDGFGANINHRSWNNDELKPVLDALVDQAGMTLFRVIYDKTDWESTNANSGPNVTNWAYFSQIYSSAEFQKMWDLTAYLNQKGITDGVMFNFQGNGPAWLGSPALNTGMEAAWADMVGSLLIYARQTNHLQFGPVGPDNEMDQTVQGVNMTVTQYTNALHKLSDLLDANGMSDLHFVGPDLSSGGTAFMPQMLADPVVMSKLAHFGMHSYTDGGGASGVASLIQSSAYPSRNYWMDEFNVWCAQCDTGTSGTDTWAYASLAARYLCDHLANGASACLVWEGYDSQYNYYNPLQWSYWGLFAVDNPNAAVKTYTPRKIFYTLAQISKWVRPGAQYIGVSGSPSPFTPLLAFKHPVSQQVTIVGINTAANATLLTGSLSGLPTVPSLDLYYTSATTNLAYAGSVPVSSGNFSATVPGDCVFTLASSALLSVAITNPVNGAQFSAPADISISATASSSTGSVASVAFYNGSVMLGAATTAPYQFTWTNVPMGDYPLTALAIDSSGNGATSAVVNVSVAGPLAQIGVTPANASVLPNTTQQFVATGSDALSHILAPQPAFVWSVSGGGTINPTGLFTAGGVPGGPFSVQAASGGVTGTAVVSVAAVMGGTLGNTNEGTLTDNLWDTRSWINACRFQAGSTMSASAVHAKVGAITGHYKCAIYTDSGGSPSALLGGTLEATNPAAGWSVMSLTTPLILTNAQYYWLAIWSDNSGAKVYLFRHWRNA